VDAELADKVRGSADRANTVEDRVDLPFENVNNVFHSGKIGFATRLPIFC
jgi:hypothetical protein